MGGSVARSDRDSQLKLVVLPWREEGRECAFVRFETGPGEESQMDWGHFGNWEGRRLYAFALTLCYSCMPYLEFTQRQDIHQLLSCMVHAFRYWGAEQKLDLLKLTAGFVAQTGPCAP
jgi:transposase